MFGPARVLIVLILIIPCPCSIILRPSTSIRLPCGSGLPLSSLVRLINRRTFFQIEFMSIRKDVNLDSVNGQRLVTLDVRQIRVGDAARINDRNGVLPDDLQLAVARDE